MRVISIAILLLTLWPWPSAPKAKECERSAFDGRIVFQEDFERGSLADRGWTVDAAPEQSLWEMSDGSLKATCFFKPYKGGRIRREVPYVPRGELTFDAQLAQGGGTGYNHLSLQFIYGMMLSFKNYGGHHLLRYHGGKWRRVASNVPMGKWVRMKVRFDGEKKIAEYYCGDMQYPASIETGIVLKPKDGARAMELAIGNYGLCTGTLVHRVDRIVLTRLPQYLDWAMPKQVTVYRGISFERLRVSQIVKRMGAEDPAVFTMQTGLGLEPSNRFYLDRMPSILSPGRDRAILFADLPLGPNDAMPTFLQEKIRDDVRSGAKLVVLGGPFTLGNGCFQGTCLEPMLPVGLKGPWEIVRAPAPLPLRGASPSLAELFDGSERPTVFYYHQIEPKPGSRVIAYAGDRPIMFECDFGKGAVVVFAGAALGKSTETHQGFWQWSRWPDFVVKAAGLEGE